MTGSNDGESAHSLACGSCRSSIKPWLDGELAPERAALVKRHVDECPECDAIAGDFRALSSILRAAGDETQERLFRSGAARRTAAEAIERGRRAAREEVHVVRLLQRVASAAAAVLVVTLGLQVFHRFSDGNTVWKAPVEASLDGVLELALSDPTWRDD